MHTLSEVAALTCLCLQTRLKHVYHEALMHTMTGEDRNRPLAVPLALSVVLCFVNTTDDCTSREHSGFSVIIRQTHVENITWIGWSSHTVHRYGLGCLSVDVYVAMETCWNM